MELVDLMYRYVNRLINSERLINSLTDSDKTKYSEEELKIIDKLIADIKKIIETIPNEIDEMEIKRTENIERILKALKKAKENENNSLEIRNQMSKQYDKMLKDKEIVRDGGKLYEAIFDILTNNSLIIKCADGMTDKELLNFITKYISVPFPPEITQDDFNDLVKVGIEEDKREALWRLAFNYNHKNKDFKLIEDYFVKVKDDYYIIELICAVKEDLDMDKLIEKILASNDKSFIEKTIEYGNETKIFTEDELEKLQLGI